MGGETLLRAKLLHTKSGLQVLCTRRLLRLLLSVELLGSPVVSRLEARHLDVV